MTPGYSSAGVVEAVGAGVTGSGRATWSPASAPTSRATPSGCVVPGAAVRPAARAGSTPRWGAFAALGAIAGHGLRSAEVEAGSIVAVIGLGLIGQIACQLATAAGARVVAVDPDRRARASSRSSSGRRAARRSATDDAVERVPGAAPTAPAPTRS